jgi:HD-GYP domain-containing protein (c-di-GMP phosphodiesterase class II)
MAHLSIQTGAKAGMNVPLELSNFVLGRSTKASLHLPDDGASRHHAELFRIGGLYFIRDLNSRNGTFVNERKITEVVLHEGDQIRIGETVLVYLDREGGPRARALRVRDGAETIATIRVRDTLVGVQAPPRAAAPAGTREPEALRRDLERKAARIIASETCIEAILKQLATEMGTALHAERVDILLIEEARPELKVRSLATYDTKAQGEIALSKTILSDVVQSQEAVLTANAAADARYVEAASILLHAVRSVLCVPVVVAGKTVGAIYATTSQSSESFSKADLEGVANIALELSAVFSFLRLCEGRERVLRDAIVLSLSLTQGPDEARAARVVASHAHAIAAALQLSAEQANCAWAAGMLHRSGDRLSALVRDPGSGSLFQPEDLPALEAIAGAVASQDERHDGSGSPRGKLGDEIPILGRILAFAAELGRLPHAAGEPPPLEEVLGLLRTREGKFHPDVVQALLLAHRNGRLALEPGYLA